jgi:hypothetical protein
LSVLLKLEIFVTLEDISYLSQSIASVAVVGSLVYLGLQVRYAERSQRGIMQQGRANRTSQASLALASPDLACIWQKACAGDPDLTCQEFTQWMLMCRAVFLSGEDSFMQNKEGLLAPSANESYIAGIQYYMSLPGFRAAWKLCRNHFGQEFRNFGDAILVQVPMASETDAYSEWKILTQSSKNRCDT